ncbi:MAG: 50S ribosomal protein L9 [Treponema sp.]|nr:50S ribosomal protein L9 [Treponema sp.]
MKVILNRDLSTLGEEGDVKDVANGYARNYLFPRGIALPYNPQTVKLFEARRGEIEARKASKRQDAMGLKERLENLEVSITMPAGANGKLYGAVTPQTVADELVKQGFDIDRRKIDLAAISIKVVGKYKATVRLYENSKAEIQITVIGQEIKTESPRAPARPARRRRDDDAAFQEAGSEAPASPEDAVPSEASASAEGDASPEPAASEPEPEKEAGEV